MQCSAVEDFRDCHRRLPTAVAAAINAAFGVAAVMSFACHPAVDVHALVLLLLLPLHIAADIMLAHSRIMLAHSHTPTTRPLLRPACASASSPPPSAGPAQQRALEPPAASLPPLLPSAAVLLPGLPPAVTSAAASPPPPDAAGHSPCVSLHSAPAVPADEEGQAHNNPRFAKPYVYVLLKHQQTIAHSIRHKLGHLQ